MLQSLPKYFISIEIEISAIVLGSLWGILNTYALLIRINHPLNEMAVKKYDRGVLAIIFPLATMVYFQQSHLENTWPVSGI